MTTVKPPWGEISSAEVTLREGGRVLLKNSDDISPVLPVKIVPEPGPIPKGPRTARKGSGALCHAF